MDTMEMGNTRLQGGEGMHRSWRYAPPPPQASAIDHASGIFGAMLV